MKTIFTRPISAFSISTSLVIGALTILAFSPHAQAGIQDKDLKFTYMVNEGSIYLPCVHYREDQTSHYWKVKCNDGGNITQTYKVYFNIRVGRGAEDSPVKQAYEFLYFINDRNQKQPSFSSQGTWLHLRSLSEIESLAMDLSLENDYSLLRLEFTPSDGADKHLEISPKKAPAVAALRLKQ
jgi:hypothetical protein